jgi:hypothetical protein
MACEDDYKEYFEGQNGASHWRFIKHDDGYEYVLLPFVLVMTTRLALLVQPNKSSGLH